MQNPSVGNKSTGKQLQNISESVRDSAEQSASEFGQKASRLTGESTEATGEYYEKASSWIQENYGKTLGALGFLAAAGTIGYLLGKGNQSESEYQASQRR